MFELMNEIYVHYQNPLHNFLPTQKLKEKARESAKLIKKFDKPRTSYAHLLERKGGSMNNFVFMLRFLVMVIDEAIRF